MNGPQFAYYYNMARPWMDQLASGAITDRSSTIRTLLRRMSPR